jgi:uncharacterized protein (TIGR02145 family)
VPFTDSTLTKLFPFFGSLCRMPVIALRPIYIALLGISGFYNLYLMFRIRNNFRERMFASCSSMFLLSCFLTGPHALAQGPGCTNTMPGNTTGDLGCVTFTYKGQTVTYTTVRAADGNVWLRQNLGAADVATAKNDTSAYGDLFQWGRWDDGHQSRSSATSTIPATNNPSGIGAGSPQFIIGSNPAVWWSGGQLTDTWDAATPAGAGATQGVDPCKAIGAGWRLPTQAEWSDVVTDEAITTPDLAFSSNLKLTVGGSRSSSSGGFDFTGTRGYYWSSTTSSTGAKYYYFSAAINNPNAGNVRGGGASVRCLNTNGSVNVVDSVALNTLNNVTATITTNAGTLSLQAAVYPAIVSQAVSWSIQAVSGAASISSTGVVTAQSNGTVWAKAVSVTDTSKSDSLLITISNQIVPVTSVDVTTQNNVPAVIATSSGILQIVAAVLPAAANQSVTWSIVPGSGAASISNTGLITAQSNGTVWAKAVSVSDNSKSDSLQITISGQGTTGVNVLEQAIGLAVYPNPIQQQLIITVAAPHPGLELSLTDLYGRVILQAAIPQHRHESRLATGQLAQGIYLLSIKGKGIQLTHKIIKQ